MSDGDSPGVFLGMLRSDLDDTDALPAPWSGIPPLVERVVNARAAGKLSDVEALETLAQVKVVQSDGSVWMVGAQSLRWYRRLAGGLWSPSPPPRDTDDPAVHASASAAATAVADALAPR